MLYGSENGHSYDSWKAVRDNEFIFGQFIWTGIDYPGESRGWPLRGFNSGMIDLAGLIKPRGYFRMAMWSESPMTYIGTYMQTRGNRRGLSDSALPVWNYKEGDTVRLVGLESASNTDMTNYRDNTHRVFNGRMLAGCRWCREC